MNTLKEKASSLTNLQMELLKSLKYMASEEQVAEVRSLLRYYFTKQLNAAIDKAESDKNYSAAIYESWLQFKPGTDSSLIPS